MKKLFLAAAIIGAVAVTGAGVFAQTATTTTTASGTVQVVAAGPVSCSPSTYTLPMGQSVTLTASGGDGNYTWSSPGLVITNPTGVNFTVAFNAAGTYPVTVTSAGMSSTCSVAVTAATNNPGTTPGLPNTGELPE